MPQLISRHVRHRPFGPATVHREGSEVPMKTQGEIEAAVCEGMARFEQEYMGRGPKHINAHLIGDLLVVRLQGVLTAAEQQLVKCSRPGREGLAQASPDPADRNGAAARGSNGPGGHRRQGVEPAPRHQHRDRRRGRAFHPDRAPDAGNRRT